MAVLGVCAAACGGVEAPEPLDNQTPGTVTEPLARVPVEPMSLTPGCFVPVATSTNCGTSICEEARAANRANEAAARELLAPFMAISREMAANRTAGEWHGQYTWPAPHDLTTDITARSPERGADAGIFTVDLHDSGLYQPPEGGDPEMVDAMESFYGAYTPNFALVDLKSTIVRWTRSVVSMGPIYRGCDPRTETSFDTRFDDAGGFNLRCWDSAGNDVDCSTVELWPH